MKTISKRALCFALTLALCAGLLTAFAVPASALSLEEKQRAVVLTAWAYYDKGKPVQYDSKGLSVVSKGKGGTLRITHEVSPEDASPDETIYSVCSDFCYQVYYNAFGFKLCGNPIACCTAKMSRYNPGTDPICAYKYNSQTDSTKREDAITAFLAALQPGDVINSVSIEGNGGHAMLYVGDVLGDGKNYILHCSGYKYNVETGEDTIECAPGMVQEIPGKIKLCSGTSRNNGGISLVVAEDYLRQKYTEKKNRVLSAIRPLNVITDKEYPMTDAAKGRLQFPRIVIDRTATPYTRFNDVEEGGSLTLRIALKSYADKPYRIPVSEVVPDGVTFVKASDGATVSGKDIAWTVDLPAGGSKTLTIDYAVTAKRGETIVSGGGKVGTIPSNTLRIPVGGKHLTAEENAKLADIAAGKYKSVLKGVKNSDFAQKIYQNVLGIGVKLPTSTTMAKKVLKTTTVAEKTVYIPREDLKNEQLVYRKMLVPEFVGGFYWGEMDSHKRVLDLKCDYLYPGDIVIEIKAITNPAINKTLVYAGNGQFLQSDRGGVGVTDFFALQKAHTNEVFFALRPTLAYDDVHTLPAPAVTAAPADEWKFTDVKQSDWFYEYVRDLVEDGTVNGMTETTFVPQGTLTYGQALKLIALAVGENEPAKTGAHWASGYLKLAKDKKWLTNDVDLDGTVTRVALCRIAAKAKGLTEQPASNPFSDTSDKDVLALNKAGVISGMTATTFQPEGKLTRAQIAKIIRTLRDVKTAAPAPAQTTQTAQGDEETD